MKDRNVLPQREAKNHGSEQFPLAYYQVDGSKAAGDSTILFPHHWHEETEILYFRKGRYHLEVNMETYDLENECFCFINSGELHFLKTEGEFWEGAVVFSPKMLLFADEDLSQEQYLRPLREGDLSLPRVLRKGEPGFSEVRHSFSEIMRRFSGKGAVCQRNGQAAPCPGPAQQLGIKGALLQILAELGSQGTLTTEPALLDHRVEMVKKAILYMREHYREKLYVRQIAIEVGMNEQYFCRFFKRAVGKSPMNYVSGLRIREAARLLRESSRSVTEISFESGFNNLGNFMKTFREEFGCTPLQYRKTADRNGREEL